MKLIYKVLIIFYSILIIGVAAWVIVSLHESNDVKKYSYKLFDSTFSIKTPFKLSDDSIARFAEKNFMLDTVFERSYTSMDIEVSIVCWKSIMNVTSMKKKALLNDWLTDKDSSFKSASHIDQEKLKTIHGRTYEYYEGAIDFLPGHSPTNQTRRYFTSLITWQNQYLYFIDIRYNHVDNATLTIRDAILNTIVIR